jgi:hypothetical protein
MYPTKTFCIALCCLAGALAGCKEPLEFGQVSGKVSLNGKPLDEVRVVFLPDPQAGNQGVHSEGVSDAQGKYELIYSQDYETKGALVGQHRVMVEDIAAENSRDPPKPIRIHSFFSSSAKTPLRFEVSPGEQTIDLELRGSR